MDTLELRVTPVRFSWDGGRDVFERVSLIVHGHDLQDMARDHEFLFATQEGHSSLAGSYAGLRLTTALAPSRHLLGETPHRRHGTILLGCGSCGEDACWPLFATITVNDSTVTWANLGNALGVGPESEREWSYDGLGPFFFDRQPYQAALAHPTRTDVVKVPRPLE